MKKLTTELATAKPASNIVLELYRGLTITVSELDNKKTLPEDEIQSVRDNLFAMMLMIRSSCPKQHLPELHAIESKK